MAGDLESVVRAWTAAYTEEVAEFAPPDQVSAVLEMTQKLLTLKMAMREIQIQCFASLSPNHHFLHFPYVPRFMFNYVF